ncbi:iron reductase [Cristinia sonorae]|uniref:Iron reductase n=1 Tax=Cristinia sonorae TaxID=1940300 RepID=A0A8K0UIZ5_9AGAR|nr:iron reductase [Cristinia sonorae]
MGDFGAPPVIPEELRQYNSYVEDPKWQRKFSAIWATAAGIAILCSLPYFVHAVKSGRAFTSLFGISEDWSGKLYAPVPTVAEKPVRKRRRTPVVWLESIVSLLRWTLPGVELSFGQMIVIIGYLATILICSTMGADLVTNSNRAGFMALAQLPVVFLFATKNSVLSLLLGPGNGYEKLNYIHRWAGRGMFICATVHGSLWIRNHIQYDLPIMGQQKETSGVAAFSLLCILVLTSLRPIRRFLYQAFWVVHVLGFVAFFVTICYHTIYAAPWIYPPLAFYGLDLAMRLLRYRIKDASLVPVDQNMTLIHIHDCDAGWTAGQHVRLRVFFDGRISESHPLTIVNAPPSTSCIPSRSLTLAARVRGDWTRALNVYAREEQARLLEGQTSCCDKENTSVFVPVHVMLDGAYGGCSIDLGSYESILLVAGGSGATFTLGMLDDIVARCVKLGRRNGERTRRVEFAWCIRSFGCIDWFAPQLMAIANTAASSSSFDLHISVFVTCICNPDAIPPIPNSDVTIFRPSVTALLRQLTTPPSVSPSKSSSDPRSSDVSSIDLEDVGEEDMEALTERAIKSKLPWVGSGGGVGVCASGPESLIREAQNAVARLGVVRGREVGGVGLHTELFAL